MGEAGGLIRRWDVPWCIGGDFNVTRFPSERLGAASISIAMEEFSVFVFCKVFWILPFRVGISLGLVIGLLLHHHGLELTGFSFSLNEGITSQMWFKADYPEFSHISVLYFLIVAIIRGAKVILSLKTCG